MIQPPQREDQIDTLWYRKLEGQFKDLQDIGKYFWALVKFYWSRVEILTSHDQNWEMLPDKDFYVVLACHQPVLDVFNEGTVHFPLSSATD